MKSSNVKAILQLNKKRKHNIKIHKICGTVQLKHRTLLTPLPPLSINVMTYEHVRRHLAVLNYKLQNLYNTSN